MGRILRRQMIFAVAVVACLAVGACASRTSGRGNLGTVAGGPAPATATSGPSATPPGSGRPGVTSGGSGGPGVTSGGGASGGGGSGGATSGGATSTSGAPVKVTAVIDPYDPAVMVTDNCPHPFITRATISVSTGPIDLKYLWEFVDRPAATQTLHFDGTGPQSKVVSNVDTFSAYDADIGKTLVIFDMKNAMILHQGQTFHLTCGVTMSTVQPGQPATVCPYITDFSVTMRAQVKQHVTYEWHLGDGTVIPGEVDVPALTSVTESVTKITVTARGFNGTYHVTFKVTSLGGGIADVTLHCPTVNK